MAGTQRPGLHTARRRGGLDTRSATGQEERPRAPPLEFPDAMAAGAAESRQPSRHALARTHRQLEVPLHGVPQEEGPRPRHDVMG